MDFIGQYHIMQQLQLLLPKLYEEKGSANILLRGPSGWGKTRMALKICNYLTDRNFQYVIGDRAPIRKDIWVHLVDEVHIIEKPEYLYPLMDSGKYVFVFTTNDVNVVPEALSNRCFDYIFEPYTIEQLRLIAGENLCRQLPSNCLDMLIDASGNNPRILIALVNQINLYQIRKKEIHDVKTMEQVLKNHLGIVNGLDTMCQRYLDALKSVGGKAGLDTLSIMLHINKDSIRFNIEPILLNKKLIQISSKGRIIL